LTLNEESRNGPILILRQGREGQGSGLILDRPLSLEDSAILDSGTTIHIFNEITRFVDFKPRTLVTTCRQANIRSRLRDMELSTLSKPLAKIKNSRTKSFVSAMSLSAPILQQTLYLFNNFTNEDCGGTTDLATII